MYEDDGLTEAVLLTILLVVGAAFGVVALASANLAYLWATLVAVAAPFALVLVLWAGRLVRRGVAGAGRELEARRQYHDRFGFWTRSGLERHEQRRLDAHWQQ